jgi:hypothetical protein
VERRTPTENTLQPAKPIGVLAAGADSLRGIEWHLLFF